MADRPGPSGGDERVEPARDARHELARKIDPRYADGELVRVGWAANQAEAELLQGLLLEHGIPSTLRRSRGFDVPDFLAAGPRDVFAPASGAEAARGLLAGTGADAGAAATAGAAAPTPLRTVAIAVALLLVALAIVAVAWLLAGG